MNLKKPKLLGFICVLCGFFLALSLPGCRQPDSKPPENPVVAKPDEMYIVTKNYAVRVSENSPWYNIFWTIADKTCKADAGTEEIYWDASTRCKNRLARPPVSGLEKPFKPGQVVFKETKTGRLQGGLPSTSLVLWYKEVSKLFLKNDPLPRVKPEVFKQEMAASGYPIEETAEGAFYWVRMIVIRPGAEAGVGDSGAGVSYTLLVENSKPPQAAAGSDQEPLRENGSFHGFMSRPVDTAQYDPSHDFKRHLPRFEKREVYRGKSFWLGSCKAGG
ncbi:MAG: hypothetical protein AB1426_00420 [Bacillota bacterium]